MKRDRGHRGIGTKQMLAHKLGTPFLHKCALHFNMFTHSPTYPHTLSLSSSHPHTLSLSSSHPLTPPHTLSLSFSHPLTLLLTPSHPLTLLPHTLPFFTPTSSPSHMTAGVSTLDIRTRLRITEAELAIVQREVLDLLAERNALEASARQWEESWR